MVEKVGVNPFFLKVLPSPDDHQVFGLFQEVEPGNEEGYGGQFRPEHGTFPNREKAEEHLVRLRKEWREDF